MKITTLNMCLFPVGLRHCLRGTNKDARLNWLIELLQNQTSDIGSSDVVCLQEVFSSWYSHKFTNIIKRCAKENNWFVFLATSIRCCSGLLLDSGLMVLSRIPIKTSEFIQFEYNPGCVLRLANKGFMHIEFVNGVHLINCHLHPFENSLMTEKHAIDTREKQLNEIKNYIDESDDVPIILTGDFNIHQGSQEAENMKNFLKMPNEAIILNNENTVHHENNWCTHCEILCCDYAIGRNVDFHKVELLKHHGDLSDHYPISFDVKLA